MPLRYLKAHLKILSDTVSDPRKGQAVSRTVGLCNHNILLQCACLGTAFNRTLQLHCTVRIFSVIYQSRYDHVVGGLSEK